VSGQLHAPAALPPGKSPRYPFYRRLGGPQSRSGRYGEVKNFDPTGTRTPAPLVVQPVASRYTDWAIPAPSPQGFLPKLCMHFLCVLPMPSIHLIPLYLITLIMFCEEYFSVVLIPACGSLRIVLLYAPSLYCSFLGLKNTKCYAHTEQHNLHLLGAQ
jgi:hypothetical protein